MILEASIAAMLAAEERPPLLPKVETFAERASKKFQEILMDLAEAKLRRDPAEHAKALARVQSYIAGTLVLGNLTGRRSTLIEADKAAAKTGKMRAESGIKLAEMPTMPDYPEEIPKVEFQEAIRDLVAREPRLAGSAAEVSRLYAERHAFALARVTDMRVTQRVQEEVVKSLREGRGGLESKAAIKNILEGVDDYMAAYSETIFRTNAWTAFTSGQFQQAQDPDVREVLPAFEFRSVNDGDTRENHAAADGLIAAVDDPVWNRFAPPLGFQCRCSLEAIEESELRRLGLIDQNGNVIKWVPPGFHNAKPDPGFGMGRPGQGLPVGV